MHARWTFAPGTGALHVTAWLLAALLAGCGPRTPAAHPHAGLNTLGQHAFDQRGLDQPGRNSIQWHGVLGCADCDGIDTELVLQRVDAVREYRLSETYLAGDQGARFVDHGHWRRHADLLQLQGDNGSLRVFALLDDGGLQPRDGRGQPLAPRDGDVLEPVAAR